MCPHSGECGYTTIRGATAVSDVAEAPRAARKKVGSRPAEQVLARIVESMQALGVGDDARSG
jgi:hypothetical protein